MRGSAPHAGPLANSTTVVPRRCDSLEPEIPRFAGSALPASAPEFRRQRTGVDAYSTSPPRRVNVSRRSACALPRQREAGMNAAADALLFLGALAGGFVSGLAGFGTALMALGIWLYVLPPSLAVPLVLVCSVIAQTATLPSMWRTFDLTLVWPFIARRACRRTHRHHAGRPRRSADFQTERRRAVAGVSDRALLPAPADGVSLRRQAGGCRNRICRRDPWRSSRPVGPAADPVGQRARLGQGRAARRVSDFQLDHPARGAVPADSGRHGQDRKWPG